MPPFGDVLEISTLVMAYLDEPMFTYAWIESEPRAIQADERERVWRATQAEASRASAGASSDRKGRIGIRPLYAASKAPL